MEFLHPQFFFGFLAIPLLYLLNLYRHRRLKVPVSSLIIWSRIQKKQDLPRTSRRKYINLSLILEVAALSSLVLSLASPTVRSVRPVERRIHILFDLSASMGALSEKGENRIDRAKLQAKRVLDSLTQYDSVSIETVPAAQEFIPDRISPDSAWQIISALRVSSLSADAQERAGQIAGGTARETEEIFVFTDKLPRNPQPTVHYICSGEPADNCAITRFSLRKMPADSQLYEAFVLVRNFSAKEMNAVVRLTDHSGRLLAQSPVSLPPDSKRDLFFTIAAPTAKGELLKVEMDSPDQLQLDNYAYATLFAQRDIHVALLGKEDKELIRALSSYPGIRITRLEKPDTSRQFDLMILNEYSPSVLPPGNCLIIAPPKEIPGILALAGEIEVKSQNPISTGGLFTDISAMRQITIAKAKRAMFADSRNFQTLLAAETEEGTAPLIGILRRDEAMAVYLAFSLSQSDWKREVSFPLFFAFLLESVSDRSATEEFLTFRTGEVVPIAAKNLLQIRTPQGKVLPVAEEPSPFYPLQLSEAGIYEIHRTDSSARLGASLLSESESDTSGVAVDFDPSVLRRIEKRQERVIHLYRYFLILAALLMIADWVTGRLPRK